MERVDLLPHSERADGGFGFANGKPLALRFASSKPVLILNYMNELGTGEGPAGVVLAGGAFDSVMSTEISGVGTVEVAED
jgi:hypothetical protein